MKNRLGANRRQGYTLTELIVVIAMLSIVILIATLAARNIYASSQKNICVRNQKVLSAEYNMFLLTDQLVHSQELLLEFTMTKNMNLCPNNGLITYNDGKFLCSKHIDNEEVNIESEVPFLNNTRALEKKF